MAEEELKENRFSYLLQPIRDLAANWDINIAGELEEYLEELENITFTIEGCGPALNFAEAALLIQGTTCVFSKKVEYLHNLVYQALETIFNKKQKEKQAAANKDKAVRRGVTADEVDDPAAFFCLEQALELAGPGDIELGEDDETAPPELLRPPTALLALEDAACGQGGQAGGVQGEAGSCRLAQCTVHCSGALLLESRDGELYDAQLRMAGRHRAAAGLGIVTAAGRLAAGFGSQRPDAVVGLMGLQGMSLPEEKVPAELAAAAGEDDPGHEGYADDCYGDDHPDGLAAGGDDAREDGQTLASLLTGGEDAAADWDMTDAAAQQLLDPVGQQQQGVAGAATAGDEDVPDWLSQPQQAAAAAAEVLEDTMDDAGEVAAAAAAGGDDDEGDDAAGAGGAVRRQRGRGRPARDAVADYFDPYAPLDPTEPGPLPIKPLLVRKPKRRTHLPAADGSSSSSSVAAAGCLNASRHPQLHWPEFGYLLDKLAAAAAASRLSSRRRGQQQQQQQQQQAPGLLHGVGQQVAPVMDWQDAAAAEQREQEGLMEDEAAVAAAEDGGFGGDGYEDDGYDAAGAGGLLPEELEEAAGGLHSWAGGDTDGLPDWLRGDAAAGAGGGGGAEGGVEALSYEELCRSHIESLIAAAAAQQVQSELAVRVSGWRHRIDPILAAEEERDAFDIHDYGSRIINRLVGMKSGEEATGGDPQQAAEQANNSSDQQQQQLEAAAEGAAEAGGDVAVDFQKVAGEANSFEVARLFAAMLQLVNNRNVALIKVADGDDDGGTASNLQLQLLTVARVHEAMAEGLAAGGGGNREPGLLSDGAELDVPPPRSKAPAGNKSRGKKAAAAAAAAAADADGIGEAASGKGSRGRGKAGKAGAGGGGGGAARGGQKKKPKKGKGHDSSSSSEDSDADSSSDGVDDVDMDVPEGGEGGGAVPKQATGRSRAAAARRGGRKAAGKAKGKAKAGAAAASDGSDGDDDGGGSSEEFDAEAENQGGARAAVPAGKAGGTPGGKVVQPPAAKRARRAAAALA